MYKTSQGRSLGEERFVPVSATSPGAWKAAPQKLLGIRWIFFPLELMNYWKIVLYIFYIKGRLYKSKKKIYINEKPANATPQKIKV